MTDNGYVTVANFGAVFEAELARGSLEAAGIPAQVRDANTASITGHHMIEVIGGIRLQVREQDRERALEILNQVRAGADDKNVFLVRVTRTRQAIFFGVLLGGALGTWVTSATRDYALGFVLALVGALLGLALGRRSVRYECSDPKCATRNRHGATVCEGCHGVVRGEIKNRDQRLAAEEELGL